MPIILELDTVSLSSYLKLSRPGRLREECKHSYSLCNHLPVYQIPSLLRFGLC